MAIPEFLQISWYHGWWFTMAFGLVNCCFLFRYPRRFPKRVFRFPSFKSTPEKVISLISVVVFTRGLMILTIFVPIRQESIWFYPGLGIFLAGMFCYVNAMKHFAETEMDKPVTTGVYRLSRHPMQVFSLIMWIGVGLATTSPVILLVCCVQPVIARVFMISQERFCLLKYGEVYREYLRRTPRFLVLTEYKPS